MNDGVFADVLYGTILVAVAIEIGIRLRNRRPGTRTRLTELPSLVVVTVTATAGSALGAYAAARLPALDLPGPAVLWLAVALPFVWAGVALRLYAVATLGRWFRLVVHVQEEHQVVQHGPYRLVRHPAYTALLIALLGLGLARGNLAAVVITVVAGFLGLLYRIRVEERTLGAALGTAYTDYAARTARLVPHVW